MHLHLICRGTFRSACREYMSTCTYPNSFDCIFIHVRVSAITIIDYNQLAPMHTPKLQLIKHRSDRNGSNSKLRNYWRSTPDKAQIPGLNATEHDFIQLLGAYALKSFYAYILQPPRPLRNDPRFIQYIYQ